MSEAIEALAEAWASLDGKLDEFHAGRASEDTEGDYYGYLSDAAELATRSCAPGATGKRRPCLVLVESAAQPAAGDRLHP